MDVKTLCIGILSLGDASGYEIKKQLEDRFSYFYDASFGSIYPALNKLQKEGLVTCYHENQSNRPDKKVYHLTSEGRLELLQELNEEPAADRVRSEFLVVMVFSQLLSTGRISELIDQRISETKDCIANIERLQELHGGDPTNEFVAGFGLAIHRAAVNYLEENRHLVEGQALLAQLERDRSTGNG